MSEYEPPYTDTATPPSVDVLFERLWHSISIDRGGLTVEQVMTDQELEWVTQEILSECNDLEEDQMYAAARAVCHNRGLSPQFVKAAVNRLGDYLSALTQFATVHPSSLLPLDVRVDIMQDTQDYASRVASAYEIYDPSLSSNKHASRFVSRVVGGVAVHAERLERPAFIQDVGSSSQRASLRLG